ncbi:TAXI family TRAP transporter solute-binding subunit [Oceaniovalibus sp. ACAM 378]|uniref:TAXI family TRAP transporter solute-binding subunit n=1 Tax=Oceaniovalibus sp. ACAM 378 TaxID=2599923 RepID=UPI0011D34D72|nr:TAXI family TRAP transporter solute-binding subunit [Oceaniovalibus sp. ACAM 378]TYB83887.1 TAXI family TRAP transporter solute-binding subunit [Oceaniovalibus sp. ACAM 378]
MIDFTTFARGAALSLVLAASPLAAQEELRMGTASLGGAFYPVGQAAANLVNKYAEGYTMVPVVTAGGTENPRLIGNGEVDFAIGNANTSFFAHEGQAPYADPIAIASIGTLHNSVLHIVTLAGSDIMSIADLKGKRVAVGPAGGGTLNLLGDVMALSGVSFGDITPSFVSYSDGFSQLSDGAVDVAVALSGYPAGAVIQTSTTADIAFVDIGSEGLAEIVKEHPYYSIVEVPADAYSTDASLTLLGTKNILITQADADEEKVYQVTKAIYDHLEEFAAENANALQIVPEDAYGIAVPLHPGAKRYFDER